MQKCTLSRIKSYEEKHYPKSKKPLIIRKNSSNNSEYLNNINNKKDITGKKLSINENNVNLKKANSQINACHTHFIKKNNKLNNEEKNKNIMLKNIPNNFSDNKNFICRKQKTYFIQRKNIRILSKNIQNQKNYLVSTGNTTGDISDNLDINEFNSEENNYIINGHIPSLTNIFSFSKYFGSKKLTKEKEKEKKEIDYNKDSKNKEKTEIEIKEKNIINNNINNGKNFSTNNSIKKNNKYIKKLNFSQSNNIKNMKGQINKINQNENNKTSSCNNLNKTNNIIKNLTYKNDIIRNKNSYTKSCYIDKVNKDEINIKKDSSNNLGKNVVSNTSKQITINKIFQRIENQNKIEKNINNKNIPNIFIKNNNMNINKKSLNKYYERNLNEINNKEISNNLQNSQNININGLNKKQSYKLKIKKNINNNSEEKKDIEIHYKSQKKNLKNPNTNKNNNINNDKKNNNFINNIKKKSTQINNNSSNNNCTKRIIKRVNKTKMIEKPNVNQIINLIYSKKNKDLNINKKNNNYQNNQNNNDTNSNKNNNIDKLKEKKQITESTIINYSNTYTNSNIDSSFFYQTNDYDSQSDTDIEENSIKKTYLSNINKNFDNAKKILNKTNPFKENEKNNLIIPKKINSCNNNKNFILNKKLKNTINVKIIYKIFRNNIIGKFLDKKSWLNLSLINKRFYKKQRILIFQSYFHKIIKDKDCEINKINLLKKIFIYSSKELKNNNKLEIIKKYDYYSRKIKSNYKDDILKDISRTFPNDINFNETIKKKLYNLLICYSNFNKKIGYTQGLNFIAATCLYIFKDEVDAFVFLDSFINRLELYNLLGFDNDILVKKIKYLELLLNKYIPDLNKYLNSKLLNHEFFSTGWIISIFSNKMEKNKLLICWCFMTVFGWKFFYSFIIQVLIIYKDTIIKSEESKLSNKMKSILNNNQFIKDFNYIIKKTLYFMIDNILL